VALSLTADLLHRDHLRTLALMNALEQRTTGRRRGTPMDTADPSDRTLLGEVAAVLAHDVDRHFAFEEGVLFPVMAEAGAYDVIVLLAQDHGTISPLARRLIALAARIGAAGTDPAIWVDFRDVAAHLADHVLAHIQKEDMAVIRRLGTVLDEDVDARIAQRFAELCAAHD
jgi:hemerythrin-like domain-containing protein